MKRSGIKRKTPLRRTNGLKRTPMKRVNKERKAKRDAEAFGEQAALCRGMPCVVCWEPKLDAWAAIMEHYALDFSNGHREPSPAAFPSDPHHEPTRAAGGRDKDTVPLCRAHHTERHDTGRDTFQAKHGVDLRAVAAALHEELTKDV